MNRRRRSEAPSRALSGATRRPASTQSHTPRGAGQHGPGVDLYLDHGACPGCRIEGRARDLAVLPSYRLGDAIDRARGERQGVPEAALLHGFAGPLHQVPDHGDVARQRIGAGIGNLVSVRSGDRHAFETEAEDVRGAPPPYVDDAARPPRRAREDAQLDILVQCRLDGIGVGRVAREEGARAPGRRRRARCPRSGPSERPERRLRTSS